jgi:hypothetical protein
VHGFVGNMADWLRCADIVVGKAGPGTIAEATCCGAPLVLTSYVPGQEKDNVEFVTGAGAGVYAPRPRQLAAEIGRLRRDPTTLAAMRDASVRAGRPGAATDIARFLAGLADAADSAGIAQPAGTAQPPGTAQPAGTVQEGTVTAARAESAALPGQPALLPALVDGAAARERAVLLSLMKTGGAKRVRVTSSFRRLRRSGTLIRAALRDR